MKKSKLFIAIVLIINCFPIFSGINCFGQYTKLLDFAGATNGSNPYGDLMYDGTFLYGMTAGGGTSTNCTGNCGVIFKIKPDGTGDTVLLNFTSATNGSSPTGSLISDGTFLYGMTGFGGINNNGTIFKIKPDGTGYVKLLDFNNTNGGYPRGSLISDGTFLYGMTELGGTYNKGTIFKIKSDGTGYVKLLDFNGTSNGSKPQGSLISDGTFLYGMTELGGTNDYGVLFKIKHDGTGGNVLLNFTGSNGYNPYGSLISDGTFLYGMTLFGGTNYAGNIFKIKLDGTGFINLLNFSNGANGNVLYGSLIFDGTFLYGMTTQGGTSSACNYGCGVLFKIKPDGTGFVKLLDFSGEANGAEPYGSLISDGTFLYGMTYFGGTNNRGTIFKYCTLAIDSINATMVSCYGGNNGTATVNVSGGLPPYTYLWSTTPAQTTQIVTGLTAGNYMVTVTDANSITKTASVTIIQSPLISAPSICLVTVDSTSTKNLIIWEKPVVTNINSFNIYREISSVYTHIASIPYSVTSIFTDITNGVNPNSASYKYKISIVDTCGNESTLSNFNRTIHVAVYPESPCGYNLIWNDYIGFPVTQYLIYRDSSNTGWLKKDSVSFGNTSWTDFTCYPANDTIAYLVEAIYQEGCNSTKDMAYNSTRSNVQSNYSDYVPLLSTNDFNLKISPNPTNGKFTVTISNFQSSIINSQLSIANALGKVIFKSNITNPKSEVYLLGQPSGIYIVSIKSGKKVYNQKLVKE
ncbi:MAG: hypothetical protein A2X08_03785 [Bacteroidetes bacterium GWA2_32_17]|nr:MAG: hypothetical protein A2X08_03785 [Bacteroidetes bacterium GWA2_32_17]